MDKDLLHTKGTAFSFRTTSWTLIDSLQKNKDADGSAALEELTRRYWGPVYAFIRSKGYDQHTAADLTQSFFSDVVLHRQLFQRADELRGRLRDLLRAAVQNFLVDEFRRNKHERKADVQPLQESTLLLEETRVTSLNQTSAERAFDRRWALGILETALLRCRDHFRKSEKTLHWQVFEHCVLQPAIYGSKRASMSAIAEKLGIDSPANVAAMNQYVRMRMKIILREVAGETAENAEDRGNEYDDVLNLLGV